MPKSWKKWFNNGIVIPGKMRFCNVCNGNIICNTCNIQFNEKEEFETNINLIKRETPNQFGHMLPHYKE